ncbi:hypothetical protein EDEG_00500 [Edhazardia aedis USNM 41457]|uniref:Uncharacterized protein n=1 Tax=Edhazardia aedis (strain USNM 41457) TaxID=1003232 RepID=J9DFD4_EDHAE|nr:hypothetical protein EDEG_00500 [Edhazardia aedis USNM 41457]|eukprot:EJW01315.1 hypothetical protein EDEG_00500 [Edhazardia aedis USNM 41457]
MEYLEKKSRKSKELFLDYSKLIDFKFLDIVNFNEIKSLINIKNVDDYPLYTDLFIKFKILTLKFKRVNLISEIDVDTAMSFINTTLDTVLKKHELIELFNLLFSLIKRTDKFDEDVVNICKHFHKSNFLKKNLSKILRHIEVKNPLLFQECPESLKSYVITRKKVIDSINIQIKNIFSVFHTKVLRSEAFNLFINADPRIYSNMLPVEFNSLSMRNSKKMCCMLSIEKKFVLSKIIGPFHPFNVFIGKDVQVDFSTYICEFVRIEYMKYIKTAKNMFKFVYVNQLIDNTGLRFNYISNFQAFIKEFFRKENIKSGIYFFTYDNFLDSKYFMLIEKLIGEMCKSKDKIRRELGVNLLYILISEFQVSDSKNMIGCTENTTLSNNLNVFSYNLVCKKSDFGSDEIKNSREINLNRSICNFNSNNRDVVCNSNLNDIVTHEKYSYNNYSYLIYASEKSFF